MIRLADISFIIGASIIVIYFILTLIRPNFIKNKKNSLKRFLLSLPILFILFAFIVYYIKIKSNTIQNNDYVNRINTNLDSLNQAFHSDTVSLQKIDSLINEIQNNREKLEQIEKEQELLQKRIRIENLNQSISDSILFQIESALKNVIVKNIYKNESKILKTSDGKIIRTADGKILRTKEIIYNDIYTIDNVEVLPILRKIDFSKEKKLHTLNYYIDSLKITFSVIKNKGKALNIDLDSLLFISINPLKADYKKYKKIINTDNQELLYLNSLYYTAFKKNTLTIDFPNISQNDTIIDFRFYLRRGLIGSFEIPWKNN